MYHRLVIPPRERLLQLARLIGPDVFVERFGSAHTAEPELGHLHALVDERLDHIVHMLVEEAAASDDITDIVSATAYLDDRLRMLEDFLAPEQAASIRAAFGEQTAVW